MRKFKKDFKELIVHKAVYSVHFSRMHQDEVLPEMPMYNSGKIFGYIIMSSHVYFVPIIQISYECSYPTVLIL
jgi:hypothetical protein